MNKLVAVLKHDMKNTFRDPSLIMISCAPLLIIFVLRTGFPILLDYVPEAGNYRMEITCFLALIGSVLPGIVMSFIMLDEKDLHLFPVIKVTPVSLSGFWFSRMIFMISIGSVISFLILELNGIYETSVTDSIQTALLTGLNAPLLVILTAGFAKNKIEDLAFLKAAFITLFIPLVIFFFNANWEYALGIFPAFWVYAFADMQNNFFIFIVGITYLSIINFFIFKLSVK